MAARSSRVRQHLALSFSLWVYGGLLLAPMHGASWTHLKKYTGLDLARADRESLRRFERDLERAAPGITAGRPPRAVYAAFLKVEATIGDIRYVLIDQDGGRDVWGSKLTFLVFDEDGAFQESTTLEIGARTHFESVEVARYPGTIVPLLQVKTLSRSVEEYTQFYGFLGNRVALLRVEASSGPWKPSLDEHDDVPWSWWGESEWRTWIKAKDSVEILAPLFWLARRQAALADRPYLRERIESLARSDDAWIRWAAENVLRP